MTYCAVKGCPNSSQNTQEHQDITFHVFPTDPIIAGRWVEQIRLNRKEEYWQPIKYTKICSLHFDESEKYFTKGGICKLRQTAIPTKGLNIVCKKESIDEDQYDPREPDKLQLRPWCNDDEKANIKNRTSSSQSQKTIKSKRYISFKEESEESNDLSDREPNKNKDPRLKTSRKREANFTAYEKNLLAKLIKKKPIIEAKLIDAKTVAKKQTAWDLITSEFNSNANVQKRETITLKWAWDNMKAFARKAHATKTGNLMRTGAVPHASSPPQRDATMSMIEDAAPEFVCENRKSFDHDSSILDTRKELDSFIENKTDTSIDDHSIDEYENIEETSSSETSGSTSPQIDDSKSEDRTGKICPAVLKTTGQARRSTDIRRKAVLRIRHFDYKRKMEKQILKTRLEVEEIKKNAAILVEERNQILLEKARMELEKLKKTI
ncbi:myb/SANT-like DNA-binding domain-containing protein 3 isoform X2 [Nymphalis io]|uniref:myb/SANT-like DNA-binding domain-containing protein 3 isoform X2 n=1 Tax=Inachis io TaxID=171585 RepID=UPI0021684E5D|nr:myb/SANT-like DNA-binding domain-containing protein 3 isoform X2 [Nymphalis io]